MKKHVLVLGLLAAVALPAAADGVYIFGDIGQTKFSGDTGSSDEKDNAVVVGLGYNLNSNFSFELGYHNLGGVDISETIYYPGVGNIDVDGSVDASAVQISAIAKLPLGDSFDVYGRLGYARIKVEATANASAQGINSSESDSASENKAVAGVGAAYKVNEKFALRAEYIKFGNTDISSITVGASYAF